MPRNSSGNPPPVAFSYMRFSNREQGKGDSIRRQTELRDGWLAKNNATLDTALRLEDRGVSGFKGKHRDNPDRHALAAFLDRVKGGRIPKGSYLIVENLDRLSREDIIPALSLLLDLIQSGIRVVQLLPVETVYDAQSNPMHLMMAIMELSRGHSESAMKSERIGKAWAEKRRRRRVAGEPQAASNRMQGTEMFLTHRLPGWVQMVGGKLKAIPAAAAAVRRIFELAASGYGVPAIIKKLGDEGFAPIGRTGRWTKPYVQLILKDRRALGEYQPRGRDGEPDGAVVPQYYPAVVTEDQWRQARAGAQQRRKNPGRVGKAQINIFSGLLKHARDGDSYMMTQRLSRSPGRPTRKFQVLVNTEGDEGRARAYSIPYAPFEAKVLECLKEIDPHEILNGDGPPDETAGLARELVGVEAELADASAFMDSNGFSPTIGKRIADLEKHKEELAGRLADARHRSSHPLSESWGEAQSLADTLAAAPDPRDARLRLRSALRRVLSSAWVLIVPRGAARLAAVQLWFAESKKHRDYLIYYRPPTAKEKYVCDVRSFASFGAPTYDLRRPDHAAMLETDLGALDLSLFRPEV